jgi:hypothetical protein
MERQLEKFQGIHRRWFRRLSPTWLRFSSSFTWSKKLRFDIVLLKEDTDAIGNNPKQISLLDWGVCNCGRNRFYEQPMIDEMKDRDREREAKKILSLCVVRNHRDMVRTLSSGFVMEGAFQSRRRSLHFLPFALTNFRYCTPTLALVAGPVHISDLRPQNYQKPP